MRSRSSRAAAPKCPACLSRRALRRLWRPRPSGPTRRWYRGRTSQPRRAFARARRPDRPLELSNSFDVLCVNLRQAFKEAGRPPRLVGDLLLEDAHDEPIAAHSEVTGAPIDLREERLGDVETGRRSFKAAPGVVARLDASTPSPTIAKARARDGRQAFGRSHRDREWATVPAVGGS